MLWSRPVPQKGIRTVRRQALWIGTGVAVWCNALLYMALLLPPVGMSSDLATNAVTAGALDLLAFLQGSPSGYDSGHFLPAITAVFCTPFAVVLALLPVQGLGHQVVAVGGGVFLAAGASHLAETLRSLALELLAPAFLALPAREAASGMSCGRRGAPARSSSLSQS